MFVQSLAVMRQQKVIESGIKVPLCHLSPLLCQYNIFYSLSQLWSVHHSVTQFRALCHQRLARLIASVARIKVSLWSPTPHWARAHKERLNISTSHKYKSKSTQRCVWTQAAVQRDTDSHLRSFLTLVFFVPWHKDVCSNALCTHYCHLDLRIISILPPPFKLLFFIWMNNGLYCTWTRAHENSTNTPKDWSMDTCMSSIVKNRFKGLDTVQV